VIDESSENAKGSQYFKCQGYDYIATQCPSRNLLIKKIDDEIETVVHEPPSSVTNSDNDIRVASIQLGVVRCSHTAVSNEDCVDWIA